MTADNYNDRMLLMELALDEIILSLDERFGKGFGKAHPEYVMQCLDFLQKQTTAKD